MSSRGSAAEVGTDDLPVCADLGGGSSGEFAAEIQHGDAVADVEDQVRMMLDQQDAAAGLPDRLDERPKARDLVGALQEAGLGVWQPVRALVRERLEADDPQAALRLRAQRRFVAAVARKREHAFGKAGVAFDRAADHHVLAHGRFADRAWCLEGAGDPEARAGLRRATAQRSVADPDLALLGHGEAADDVQRRGLAAAVWADQAVHLAGTQHEVEPVDGTDGPKAQTYA